MADLQRLGADDVQQSIRPGRQHVAALAAHADELDFLGIRVMVEPWLGVESELEALENTLVEVVIGGLHWSTIDVVMSMWLIVVNVVMWVNSGQ